jgi:hypothetical protein
VRSPDLTVDEAVGERLPGVIEWQGIAQQLLEVATGQPQPRDAA